MAQHHGYFGAVRGLARPQENRHRLAGSRLVNMDRHETAAVMIGIERAELLLAIGAILGVERNPPGHGREAVAEQIDHRLHHAFKGDCAGEVLQPGHGRLRSEITSGLGQAADCHLEGWFFAKQVSVVGVGIVRRDRERVEPDHLHEPVDDPIRRPGIFHAARDSFADPKPTLRLGLLRHAQRL